MSTLPVGELYDATAGLHVVFKVTRSCNLGCAYCSAASENREQGPYLTLETGKAIMHRLLGWQIPILNVCFHGGEPLLIFDTLREVITSVTDEARQNGQRLELGVQSNLTLLTDEMASFFSAMGVSLGFSLDGPPEVNDTVRIDRRGNGSYDRVRRGIEILKRHESGLGCVCVIHRHNYSRMGQVGQHFLDCGLRGFSVNRLAGLGRGADKLAALGISDEEYLTALQQCYHLMVEEQLRIRIDPLVDWIRSVLIPSRQGHLCYPCSAGWRHMGIDHRGNVYPCDRFSGDPRWVAGNVLHDELLDIFNCDLMRSVRLRGRSIPECQACPEADLCGGECAATAYYERGSLRSPARDCGAIQSFLPWLRERLAAHPREKVLFVSGLL